MNHQHQGAESDNCLYSRPNRKGSGLPDRCPSVRQVEGGRQNRCTNMQPERSSIALAVRLREDEQSGNSEPSAQNDYGYPR